jgi:outer membrane lipoprotein-sorting protein
MTLLAGLTAGVILAAYVATKGGNKEDSTAVAVAAVATPMPTTEATLVLEELRSYQFVGEIATGVGPARRVTGFIKGWFEGPYNTRWEFGSTATSSAEATYVQLMTEDGLWTYLPASRTYWFQPGGAAVYRGRPLPLRSNQLIGSILPASTADDEALRSATREQLFGRTVAYLELQGPLVGGTRRLWVDVKNRMVLREEVQDDPTAGSYEATLAEFTLNQDINDAVFDFVPPPGSRQTNAGPLAQSNPGPLFPAYLPVGYQMRKSDTSVAAAQFQVDSKVYDDSKGNSFILYQEYRKGEPWTLADGEIRAIGRYQGHLIQIGSAVSLTWIVGEIRLNLTSSALSSEELVRIAESMR